MRRLGRRQRTLFALELTAVRGRRRLLISGSLVRVQLREPDMKKPVPLGTGFFMSHQAYPRAR
jgi:hypothetical protein